MQLSKQLVLQSIILSSMLIPVLARAQTSGEERPTIGVLQVTIQGVSDTAGEVFERSVEEGLAGVGSRVIRSKVLQEKLLAGDYVAGCTFGPCLKEVFKTTKVRLVLVARIHGEGNSYGFVVSLLDTRTGLLTSQVSQSCTVCTFDEALTTGTLAVIELVTGTGEAEVTDPAAGPTGMAQGPAGGSVQREGGDRMKATRVTGWLFVGAAVVAGAAGGYLMWTGDRDLGLPVAVGGGALAAGGGTMLILSRQF